MIDVERRKMIGTPASRIKAALADVKNLQHLLPQAERVEVQGSNEHRARLTISLRAGKLGLQRLDGEARILPNGLRFVAVRPAQIDASWTFREQGEASEVTAHLSIEPGGMFGPLGRWIPRRIIEQRIGQEIEASLQALEELVSK